MSKQINPVHSFGADKECPGCGHESHFRVLDALVGVIKTVRFTDGPKSSDEGEHDCGDTCNCYCAGLKEAYRDAIKEVQSWRALTVKYYKTTPVKNTADFLRETKNTLNLLGVIETGLQKKLGKAPTEIFKEMRERDSAEGMPEYPNG